MKKHFYCLFTAVLWLSASISHTEAAGCCKPPLDVTVKCENLPLTFNARHVQQLQSLFGRPENKCYPGVWVELEPIVHLNLCRVGTVIRRFQTPNRHGGYDICEQRITIIGSHEYKIRFPKDREVGCGQTWPEEDVVVEQSLCDFLAVSVQDHNFFDGNSRCGKIFRTYRVLNWCEYDGQSQPIVVGRDEDCDNAPGDEDVWVIRRLSGLAFIDRDHDEGNNNPRAGERSACWPSNPAGYWRTVHSNGFWSYTQHIKITDATPPVIALISPNPFCSVNNTCDALVEIPFLVDDACTPNDIKIRVFINGQKIAEYAKGGSYTASGRYPFGDHILEIQATDGCGNPVTRRVPFKVIDCKAPAPICLNGITVTLMPTPPNTDADGDGSIDRAAMTIRARDLLVSQLTDCSGVASVSINRVGERPSINKQELILTCNDLGTLDIEVYAWDAANNPLAMQPDSTLGGPNYSFCRTYLLVQINSDRCDPPSPVVGVITGTIQTENEQGLPDVMVTLVHTDSTIQRTNEVGSFRFERVTMQSEYRLIPALETPVTEGLSISDLIALQKHLMGVELIRSPYRLLAADVNRDQQLDQADADELRAVLLGLQLNFANNTSWRFIDADYIFSDPLRPWSEVMPEWVNIPRMSALERRVRFVAIKTGDVNGSVITDRFATGRRNLPTLALQLPNQTLRPGEIFKTPLQISAAQLEALQCLLQFDIEKLQLRHIESGAATVAHYNRQLAAEGLLPIVWDHPSGFADGNTALLTLVWEAKTVGVLKDALQLTERRVAPLAVEAGVEKRLILEFNNTDLLPAAFIVLPNEPNPFREETRVRFHLPATAETALLVQDVNGKTLWQQRGAFPAGWNEFRIQRNDLPNSGILFYTLQSGGFRQTHKMLLLP